MISLVRDLLAKRQALLLVLSATAILVPPSAASGLRLPYFLLCGLGLIPLAQLTAELVDHLVQRVGERLGGLLNVTLGNLLELLIALTALRSGLYELVVVSIAGAVITNSLLVLGISTMLAGRQALTIDLNQHSNGLSTRQLLISVILMSVPSVFFWNSMHPISEGSETFDLFAAYSLIVAVVVMTAYLLSYIYQLGTHRHLFLSPNDPPDSHPGHTVRASMTSIALALGLVALAIAGVSEHLVEGLEELVMGSSITPLFVGMLLLPLFSAIPEALVAFRAANRGRMALAMASTVESSVQLLLFVLPTLVLTAPLLGRFLHLTFPPQALACLGATAFAVHWVTEGNTLTWYQGLLLLSIYAALFTGALLLRPGM
jgi:Ca2+:H+ antiporter